MSRRRVVLSATLVLLAMLTPGPISAAQPEGSCGAERGKAFTMPIPEAMRTEGVHRFQYRITVTLPDGTQDVGYTDNQIEVSVSAVRYDNLLLRLLRNRGLLPDRSIDLDVRSMQPTQPASFYAQISLAKADVATVSTATMEIRYEARKNHWSDWISLPSSSVNSFCTQLTDAVFVRSYGWAG